MDEKTRFNWPVDICSDCRQIGLFGLCRFLWSVVQHPIYQVGGDVDGDGDGEGNRNKYEIHRDLSRFYSQSELYLFILRPITRNTPRVVSDDDPPYGPYFAVSRDRPAGAPALVNYPQLRQWIQGCRGNHDHVSEQASAYELKFRFIDCLEEPHPIIMAPKDFEYTALSYLWGPRKTGDKNTLFNAQLPSLVNLPALINDAIAVTKNLNFRYLWIDKYCINLNDHVEKQIQIQNMDLIYQRAALTLIAAAGNGPDYGLPGVGKRLREPPVSVQIGEFEFQAIVDPGDLATRSKWVTRAWNYQEAMLSTRRLVFTDEQVYFHCAKTFLCENPSITRIGLEPPANQIFLPVASYNILQHILAYSKRELSWESDALNAIAGIFKVLRRQSTPLYHINGVPLLNQHPVNLGNSYGTMELRSEQLAFGLNWGPVMTLSGPRRQGFPSWSWTGWKSMALWDSDEWSWDYFIPDLKFAVVGSDQGRTDIEMFDFTKDGDTISSCSSLEVTGDMVTVQFIRDKFYSSSKDIFWTPTAISKCIDHRDRRLTPAFMSVPESQFNGTVVSFECLFISKFHLLILIPVGENVVERVGKLEYMRELDVVPKEWAQNFSAVRNVEDLPRLRKTIMLV